MRVKDYHIVRNGEVIRGPWGVKPKDVFDGVDDADDAEQEVAEIVPIVEYEDLSYYRKAALEEMEDDEAFFEVFDAEDGPMMGVLIKLSRADFALVSLMYKSEEGMAVGIGGTLEVNEDETVAIPVIDVELEAFPGRGFSAMVNIAAVAEDDNIPMLNRALENGVLVIGIGSNKALMDDEVFVDDEESAEILADVIGEGIGMFEEEPWTIEMAGEFEDRLWEEE